MQSASTCACIVATILFAISKVCVVHAKKLPAESKAQHEARVANATHSSINTDSTTTYYRRNPFGPHTYAFGYEVNDKETGNIQFRDERRYTNGTVEGSYGYVRPDGRITVTHFLADKPNGYLSHTETFETGEVPKWQPNWPTKKPTIEEPPRVSDSKPDVRYDAKQHLNVTTEEVPKHVANALKAQNGIDINQLVNIDKDVVPPAVLDVINGKAPLKQQLETKNVNTTAGFETVHNFIPPDFPIVPFQLPEKLQHQIEKQNKPAEDQRKNNATNGEPTKKLPAELKSKNDTEIRLAATPTPLSAQATRKPLAVQVTEQRVPEVQQAPEKPNQSWYERIINETRSEFLQNIPNLA